MPDRLKPHEVRALREKLRRAGTFRLVTTLPFVALLSGAVLLIGGYGLHWLLSPSLHVSGPGIVVENPIAAALATCALLGALVLAGCLALIILLDASPTTRGARVLLGSLLCLCVLLYAWSLRPHYRVHADRLDIVSWRSSRSLPLASIDGALITSSLSKYNRRSYRLRFMSEGREIESLSIRPSGLTIVLAQLPQNIDCRTDREPENRSDLQQELGQAFAEGRGEKGLQLPPACLAALSL
ncbi:hypothetical protein MA04_03360 [Alcanivorax balearicus MACL04]|uniref:Uncharacterized protein n=1 Tax=Alloalcanivorax balearicus MACL04 TaxID=1177182 RepID=A0ABT2R2R2_9GAMM|nr:hypothetical protein [Alloalcanivorax balearicus]MCU5784060.1 hypothetical protein [Alloalcanivorax balearicus MACL04]